MRDKKRQIYQVFSEAATYLINETFTCHNLVLSRSQSVVILARWRL